MLMRFLNKPTQAKLSSLKKGSFLLASFKESVVPTLWHCPLRQLKNATITIREEDGVFELGTREGARDFIVVATFDEEDKAWQAMEALRNALMKEPFFPKMGPWARLSLILLVLVCGIAFALIPSAEEIAEMSASLQGKAIQKLTKEKEASKESHKIIPGVPVNADDVLVPPVD